MWDMFAQGGLNFAQGLLSYNADKAQAKAKLAWQAYSNKMLELSATQSQNAITQNTLFAEDAFANQAFQLKQDSIFTRAKVEASAAAAGVKGRSVNLAVRQVIGNAAMRESERQEAFKAAALGFDQQRKQVAMSAAMQKDYSYIPKPQAASYFLGAAMKTFSYGSDKGYF